MIPLCSNRPEGFGPHSSLHPSLPTTCFIDVILIPLPVWIYLVAMLPLLFMLLRPQHPQPMLGSNGTPSKRRPLGATIPMILYLFLLVAMIAMVSLEIARLVAASLGIGLLPFVYVGIIIVGAMHIFQRGIAPRMLNAGFWILLGVMNAVKVATEIKEGIGERKNTAYPMVDEVTDVTVIIGVCIVLAGLEIIGRGDRIRN